MERFDGHSLFLTSAVKHLGKDNNGQFFDWRDRAFLVCLLFDLSEQSKGRMQSTQEPFLPAPSLSNWSQVAF